MTKKNLILSLVLLTSFLIASVVQAQEATPVVPTDDDVNSIAKNLYCPVCPNTPLDVCETTACQDWRNQIRDQLADGWSEEQIINYFVEQYGERVLAEPRRTGFSSFVWVFPVVLFLLGLVILWQVLVSWQKNEQDRSSVSIKSPEIDPEILEKLEKEIRSLD